VFPVCPCLSGKIFLAVENEGKTPLEAIYIFFASTRAAVDGLRMTIGKRALFGRIQEYKEARRQYEQAKQQGRSAS
jgi:Ca-activated chloride channel family protein